MMYLFQFRSDLNGTQLCVNTDARGVT